MICIARDAYDEAVDYLVANPNAVDDAWSIPRCNSAGILFRIVGTDSPSGLAGCLTMICHNSFYVAPTTELTSAIRNDKRIPYYTVDIKGRETLQAFAEWQRYLDDVLDRPKPEYAACS